MSSLTPSEIAFLMLAVESAETAEALRARFAAQPVQREGEPPLRIR